MTEIVAILRCKILKILNKSCRTCLPSYYVSISYFFKIKISISLFGIESQTVTYFISNKDLIKESKRLKLLQLNLNVMKVNF